MRLLRLILGIVVSGIGIVASGVLFANAYVDYGKPIEDLEILVLRVLISIFCLDSCKKLADLAVGSEDEKK